MDNQRMAKDVGFFVNLHIARSSAGSAPWSHLPVLNALEMFQQRHTLGGCPKHSRLCTHPHRNSALCNDGDTFSSPSSFPLPPISFVSALCSRCARNAIFPRDGGLRGASCLSLLSLLSLPFLDWLWVAKSLLEIPILLKSLFRSPLSRNARATAKKIFRF